MGWFDSVVSGVGSLFSGNSTMGGIVSSVITGYALSKVADSIKSSSSTTEVIATDFGNLLTLPANQDQKIPVIYGNAYAPGYVIDAVLSADRTTMTYVVAVCEKTGTKLSGGQSVISFSKILWSGNTINFKSDGVTADSTTDSGGNVDKNVNGLIKVYCYAGGSTFPTNVTGYANHGQYANQIVPNWDSSYTMDELMFVVIKVTYDKTKGVIGVPSMSFKINNTMTMPGDCIYDYMTNTRYGCSIKPEDIYS